MRSRCQFQFHVVRLGDLRIVHYNGGRITARIKHNNGIRDQSGNLKSYYNSRIGTVFVLTDTSDQYVLYTVRDGGN